MRLPSSKSANRTRFSAISTSVVIGVMGCASSALAQSENLRPPKTSDPSSAPTLLIMAVAVLLTAIVVVAGILKSKRTHQD